MKIQIKMKLMKENKSKLANGMIGRMTMKKVEAIEWVNEPNILNYNYIYKL